MSRLLDLFAIVAVAVVLLLPKASVDARPALSGEAIELDRVSKLQDDLYRAPGDIATAVRLADDLLSFQRPDWAIATLAPLAAAGGRNARVHLVLATARAERLEAVEAVAEAKRAEEVCGGADQADLAGKPGCPPGTLARARLVQDAMQALVTQNIDPARDPQRAKEAVYKALHPSRASVTGPTARPRP